jgi:2-polyprenyl-6-methoxyphenol hydroxylase-like FAD-dependent oxidoreductase
MDQIVIVGAGLGGLLLAIMLESAAVPYILLERATVAEMPLEGGGVITLTSQIQPLLKQLRLLTEIEKVSRPVSRLEVFEADQTKPRVWLAGVLDSAFSCSRFAMK